MSGEYYCFLETFGGGYGGRAASDGPDAVQTHGQNTENAPVEETELNYPVRVTRLSLVDDSDGPGPLPRRARAAQGLPLRPADDVHRARRPRRGTGPWGAFGGLDGRPAEYVLVRGGEERRLGAKTTLDVEPGDVVSYRTCGGGGYGPPAERDPERVAARRARGQGQRRARARDLPRRGRRGRQPRRGGDRRAAERGRDRPDHVRGDPQRARRGDRRDGADAQAQRLLDQHQDPLRLLVRVLRRRAALRSPRGSPSRSTSARWSSWCRSAVRDYGAENLGPGDTIITNDPYPSGVHLNDVSLISPVYSTASCSATSRTWPTTSTSAAARPASIGAFREVFQEGVIIPPVKLVEAGRIVPDVFRLVLAQIRSKHETARRPARPDRRERDRRAADAGARRAATAARRSSTTMARAARLHRAPHAAPSSPRCRTASTRPRASSTTTATPTSRST